MRTWNEAVQALSESSFDPWESVSAALSALRKGSDSKQTDWLVHHLLETKQLYWAVLGKALGREYQPPKQLEALLEWEIEQAGALSKTQLQTTLTYGERTFSVASFVRFNARHSAWHAGQLAFVVARNNETTTAHV